jgi:hypothetical protein
MSQDPGIDFIGVPLQSSSEELLGVRVDHSGVAQADDILRALQSRLEEISLHPDRNSAEADIVRQALHDAARLLLDGVAGSLISTIDLERVRCLIAEGGGINDSTLERLQPIAVSAGVSVGDLIAAALELPAKRHPRIQQPRSNAEPESSQIDILSIDSSQQREIAGSVRLLIFIGSGLIASIALIAIVISIALKPAANSTLIKPMAAPSAAEDARGPVVDGGATDETSETLAHAAQSEVIRRWPDLIRDMESSESIAGTDPSEAIDVFLSTFERMSMTWPEASKDELMAAGNSIIDFLYTVGNSSNVDEVSRALAVSRGFESKGDMDTRTVRSICFAAAMTVRVLREPDLNPSLRSALRDACDDLFDGEFLPRDQTFDSGMRAALGAVPQVLINEIKGDPEAKSSIEGWRAWIECLAAVEPSDTPAYDRIVAVAIESAMLQLPEADRDSRTREIISMLGAGLTWRKDSPARSSLLLWFENPGVSSADLQALTSVIATQSAAAGVDPTMVLSAGADQVARTAMRDRYAQSWGVLRDRIGRQSELNRWRDAAAAALKTQVQETPITGMMMAVRHARLSSLAEALREGAAVRVPDDIDQDDSRIIERINRKNDESKLIVVETGSEREWALRYLTELKSGSVSARVAMLGSFTEKSTALNADIIAQEATRGSPEEIRKLARKVLQDRSMDPLFVNAVLRLQHKLIPNADNLQLIEAMTGHALPSFRSPSWRFECRRALVSKLTQLLAQDSQVGVIDSISESLAEAYQSFGQIDLVTKDDRSGENSVSESTLDPLAAVTQLRKRHFSQASRLVPSGREHASLGMIESMRIRRIELAIGVIQRFHAEQLACIDLLAYTVVAEEPSRSAEVREILRGFDESRRSCSHVLDAVRIGERVRLELWVLRIGGASLNVPETDSAP